MNMLLPTVAAMVNGILVGSAIVATRFVIDQSSPVSLALLRYYLWLWALNHTTPTNVTVFLALSPITATLSGALFLSERITGVIVLALVCIAGGLWIALWQMPQK
jgi:threonine/homoserine efflux transporter RhtA